MESWRCAQVARRVSKATWPHGPRSALCLQGEPGGDTAAAERSRRDSSSSCGHSSSVAIPIGGRAQLVGRLRRSGRMVCVRARTSSLHEEACNGGRGFEPWLTCHLPSKSAPVCWTRFRPSQALERSPGGRARPACSKRAHHTPRGTALPALSSSAQQLSRKRLRRSDVLLRRADGGWR